MPPTGAAWRYINKSQLWHADSSFHVVLSNGPILHGIEVTTFDSTRLKRITHPAA